MAETPKPESKRKQERRQGCATEPANPGSADQPRTNPLRSAYKRFMALSRNLRLAALALVLFIVGAILFTRIFANPAKVTIICQHGFRVAQLSVWADDELIYSGNVRGSSRSHLGILGSNRSAGLHKTIDVPTGQHIIRVRLTADSERYDQIKTVPVVFGRGGENSVNISAGRHGLSVAAQGAPNVPEESGIVTSSSKLASSVMLSIFGSGMSAAIAFLVQEFLRAQKERLTSPPTEIKG